LLQNFLISLPNWPDSLVHSLMTMVIERYDSIQTITYVINELWNFRHRRKLRGISNCNWKQTWDHIREIWGRQANLKSWWNRIYFEI